MNNVAIILDDVTRLDYTLSLLKEVRKREDFLGMSGYTGNYRDKEVNLLFFHSTKDSSSIRTEDIFNFIDLDLVINVGVCYSLSKNHYPSGTLIFVNNAKSDQNYRDLIGLHSDSGSKVLDKKIEKKIFDTIKNLDLPVLSASCQSVTSLFSNEISSGVNLIDLKAFSLYETAMNHNRIAICLFSVYELDALKFNLLPKEDRNIGIDTLTLLALELSVKCL